MGWLTSSSKRVSGKFGGGRGFLGQGHFDGWAFHVWHIKEARKKFVFSPRYSYNCILNQGRIFSGLLGGFYASGGPNASALLITSLFGRSVGGGRPRVWIAYFIQIAPDRFRFWAPKNPPNIPPYHHIILISKTFVIQRFIFGIFLLMVMI